MEGVAVGRIVHFFDPKLEGPRAAIIVRDWGGEQGCVNLKVFLDTGENGFNDRSDWDARSKAENRQGYYGSVGPDGMLWATSMLHKSAVGEGKCYWDWPARA